MTPEDFIKVIGPMARNDMARTGILASVTAAQAILESAYGTSDLAVHANNLFGMKCKLSGNTWDSVWDGESRFIKTTEEQDAAGKVHKETAEFRLYPSISDSVRDHSQYLLTAFDNGEHRYKNVAGETDYRKAVQIIKDGGYATDVKYVDKVCGIIEKYDLTRYDKGGIRMKICLDAGHFGKYNQSPCNSEYYESDMTWKLHLLLKKYLMEYGVDVITTRPAQDMDRVLYDRGADSKGCDLFISIHSNAVGAGKNEKIDYAVAYCTINGAADQIATALTECIADVMQTRQDPRIEHREGKLGDYYGVLRGAAAVGTPGLILEHSFHTNTVMTNWLLDSENLEMLAEAEAETIADFYGLKKAEKVYPEGWNEDNVGWWYQYPDGSYPENTFAYLHEVTGGTWGWYLFDARGYMLKGAQRAPDGRLFYLCEDPGINEGKCMVTNDQGALMIAEWDDIRKKYVIE